MWEALCKELYMYLQVIFKGELQVAGIILFCGYKS